MNLFKFEVKRFMKSCLSWSLICGLLVILFMSFYPSMKDSGIQELVETKLGAFPEGMLQAFGLDTMVNFTDLLEYMAYIIQYIGMAATVYASILGINSLLEEEAEGSIEFLYAQPISRREILIYKIFSRLALLIIYFIIVGLFAIVISLILRPEGSDVFNIIKNILIIFLGMFFMGLIFFSIAFFFSSLLRPSLNSTAASIGFFFITYVLGVIGKLREGLEALRLLSPFDYALPMDLIKEGWNRTYLLLGLIIITLSLLGSWILYDKRDMKI